MKLYLVQNHSNFSSFRLDDVIGLVSTTFAEHYNSSVVTHSIRHLLLASTAIINCDDYWEVVENRSNIFVKNQKVSNSLVIFFTFFLYLTVLLFLVKGL
jgi:hypothetical protein